MHSLTNLLFLDIETISGEPSYDLVSPRIKKAWEHKASFFNSPLSAAELYFQKAAIYAEFGKVVAIGIGAFYYEEKQLSFKSAYFADSNEKKVLENFIQLLDTKYAHKRPVLCAHNGKEFDFPYLCRRILINELPIPKPLKLSGKKPWEIEHVDTLDFWKFGDRKNFTSLDLLTALFDIPGSKSDMDGSKVNEVFYRENDLERIAKYCVEDVIALAQLYLKLHNKPLIPSDRIVRGTP